MISYCPQCGKPIADDVAFCPNCGASLKTTVQAQPQAAQTQPADPGTKPDNHLVWSIITILFCCMPLGVYALILGNDVNNLWNAGRYAEARDKADKSKKMNLIGLIIGGIGWFIYVIYMVVVMGFALADM